MLAFLPLVRSSLPFIRSGWYEVWIYGAETRLLQAVHTIRGTHEEGNAPQILH